MNSFNDLTRDLCAIYERAGFRFYKMRKFEEYSLYLENKDFLTSEAVITFHDPNGKLLALKPDVTLSIVKNSKATPLAGEKFYYTESVYRMEPRTHEFREIHQVGLEMLGRIDPVATLDVLSCALHSLSAVSDRFVLCLSHMGLTAAALDRAACGNTRLRAELLRCIREKNQHDLRALCENGHVDPGAAGQLAALSAVDGDIPGALAQIRSLAMPDTEEAVRELQTVWNGLHACGLSDRVRLDLSMMNDSDYYNGIIFQGYIDGIHRHVLSGGRYDRLSCKFRPGVGAMGFALYLSDLAPLQQSRSYDCDLLLLYHPDTPPEKVLACAEAERSRGRSVRIEPQLPEGLRPREVKEVSAC